ncbi:MAG: relaxase/mobilization nuclease domain-containing protein [Rhodanobacteraceae bacterium]
MRGVDEEDPILGAAGLVFRTPVRAKKHPRGNPSGSAGLKLAKAMGTIGRVVRRRPEVMVKVTGSARGFRGLKEHLAYITRNGKIAGEREGGELIEGSREVSRLAEEWWVDCGNDRPTRARDTINLILSMPPGTDPEAVAEAARAFAQKTFGGEYDYLIAHHNHDSDPKRPENPHAHLTVKTRGRDGQRLNPHKEDLQAWREEFAQQLRLRNVKAEATPRRARGVVRKGQRQAIRHMNDRRASRVSRWKIEQALKTVTRGQSPEATPWTNATRERQRKVRRAWGQLAIALEDAGKTALAMEVKQFVANLPTVATEREALVAVAQKALAKALAKEPQRHR